MENSQYDVIFAGEIAAGQQRETFRQRLMKSFNLSEQQVDAFFTGKPITIKANMDYQKALKYQTAFQRVGAVCRIEPIRTPSAAVTPAPPTRSPTALPQSSSERYNVVFSGTIARGRTREDVKKSLATLFKADLQQIERLFTGQPVIIKTQVDQQAAKRLQAAFHQAGAICRIEPITPAAPVTSPQPAPKPSQPIPSTLPPVASNPVPPPPPLPQTGLPKCPKCGYQATFQQDLLITGQNGQGECPACGIIVAKYTKPATHVSVRPSTVITTGATSSHSKETGVTVEAAFFPLAFLFFFCTPQIEIDGHVHKGAWWKSLFFPLPAGKHTVRIYFGYLSMPECGANSVDITINEGATCKVSYFMWPWMFAPGSIKVTGAAQQSIVSQQARARQKKEAAQYAAFWKRCLAGLLDSLIVCIPAGIMIALLFAVLRDSTADKIGSLLIHVAFWLYFAYFESSDRQATPGKMIFHIKVMSVDGERLSFLRATGRYFSKLFLSLPFIIGIAMAAFTQKRQGLHDLIVKSIVVDGE